MQNSSFCFFFWFFFLFAATFCHGSDLTTVEVVGVGECADCYENNIKSNHANHAFSGLRVSIDCKQKDGDFERKGVAELDEEGKFQVLLPTEVLKGGKLKQKCFAQLHSASSTPCPSHDGLESSMIVFKSKGEGKLSFGLSGGLKFKSATCVSAFFWHHDHPPLPPISFPVFPPHPPLFGHPYLIPPFHHKFFPPKAYPPPPTPEEPVPPPVYEKPPPVYEKPPPVYEKPPPVYKKPPPVYEKPPPVYEKPPPVYVKPVPPPVPVYKKPLPPPVYKPKPPVYKPEPPVYKPKPPKPPVYVPKPPVYEPKPPVYKPPAPEKPLPPPAPPVYKHPWYKILPPISKLPPCPPVPKVVIPPKYFSHPKIGKKFPPLPPSVPHS